MKRREMLGAMATFSGGCSAVGTLSKPDIGTTIERDKLAITATDVKTANEVRLKIKNDTRWKSFKAPPNGTIAFCNLKVENNDIQKRSGPTLAVKDYTDETEDTVDLFVNDVRMYGSGEGGVFFDDRDIKNYGYDQMTIGGSSYSVYPPSITNFGPYIGPSEALYGWVLGIIPIDTNPQIKVRWGGSWTMWALE